MDKELFKTWFCDLFLKNCGSARPVLLLLDNHESRYSYNVLKAAKDNEVCIKTHVIQTSLKIPNGHQCNMLCISVCFK